MKGMTRREMDGAKERGKPRERGEGKAKDVESGSEGSKENCEKKVRKRIEKGRYEERSLNKERKETTAEGIRRVEKRRDEKEKSRQAKKRRGENEEG